jgi:parallel beta-helix repeat protein
MLCASMQQNSFDFAAIVPKLILATSFPLVKEPQRRRENMETKQKISLLLFTILGSFLMVATSGAASYQLVCGQQRTITEALRRLPPGDTLSVSGACSENVQIPEQVLNITLDGQGTATINGADASSATILVRGNGITIRNFASITGGETGITVTRGGAALIDSNVIQSTGGNGISVVQSSSARIINNTIQGNPGTGIVVTESSSARIGFNMTDDTQASPNVIQKNGENGIIVTGSSNARIIGNTISGNTENGVLVNRVSHGDVSSNTIDSNGGDGVLVLRNSGVNLGEDTGSGIFDSPNITNVNNAGFGIRCAINSYGDGRIGSLNGASGPVSFAANCVNATIP